MDAPFLAAAGVNGVVGVLAILLARSWRTTDPQAVSNTDSLGDRAAAQAAEDVWGHRALLLSG